MGFNKTGVPGATLPEWAVPLAQNPGQNLTAPAGSFTSGSVRRFRGLMPVDLAASQVFVLPTGSFAYTLGLYSFLQWYEPVQQRWINIGQAGQSGVIASDGTNFRIANLTGCAVGAVITNAGSSLTNGVNTVTVTASAGGSTWNSIVGGAANTSVTITAGGTGYTKPPILLWRPDGSQTLPYLPPEFTCTISGGIVNAVTCVQQGAGLTAVGTIDVINQAGDTTGSGCVLTPGALAGSGTVTALYPATNGTAAVTSIVTFTFSPASTIAATAVMCWTAGTVTVSGAGSGLTNGTYPFFIGSTRTAGSPVYTNTQISTGFFQPRQAWGTATVGSGAVSGTALVDTGLSQIAPSSFGAAYVGAFTSAPTFSVANAGISDISYIESF